MRDQRDQRRPFHGRSNGNGRGGSGGNNGKRFRGQYINPDRLIKKAVLTERVDQTYVPQAAFAQLEINAQLKTNIERKGYKNPTPIQDQAIPHILGGRDLVGLANTGTGKTGAFLIPLLDKVFRNPREQIIIIAPTRELAEQIHNEIFSLTYSMGVYSVLCVGGVGVQPQIGKLRRQFNFVVGTPGRIKDLSDRKALNLSGFNTIVLDEVDRMLDMGFIHDIKQIVSLLPATRQTLFFSATVTKDIERLMNEFLKDHVNVSVGTSETTETVDQNVIYFKHRDEKIGQLEELLAKEEFKRVIVFAGTKIGVDKLEKALSKSGFAVESIHGNKTQGQRKRAITNFKRGDATVLLATDVAARGIDIEDVSHVINFDMPMSYEDYIHRIGRTGRAGKIGIALTFVEERAERQYN